MPPVVIDNPILNSPFTEPTRHFRFSEDGITDQAVDGRRDAVGTESPRAGTPCPARRRRGGTADPVRVEILSAASRTDRARLRRGLSALPVLSPTDATWTLLDEWIDRAGDAGERFGFGDLLIGALATETGSLVWSLDADFARMNRLRFLELYEP